jgi:hypothetical protein
VREIHSGAEPVDEDLSDLGRIKVRLPAKGVVGHEPLRLGRVAAGEDEDIDILGVGADDDASIIKRILSEKKIVVTSLSIDHCLFSNGLEG